MQKGLLETGPRHVYQYGLNEGFPLLDASVTSPVINSAEAWYSVQGRICYFWMNFRITSRGEGIYTFLAPPVEPHITQSGYVTPGGIWACMSVPPYGFENLSGVSMAWIPDFQPSPGGMPLSRQMVCFPTTNVYTPPGATATVPTGSTSVTVTSGTALKPDSIFISPLFDPRTAHHDGEHAVRYWVANATDTTFDIFCESEGASLHTGSARVLSGTTSVTVTHGFSGAAPTVVVSPKEQPSLAGCTEYWVDTITSTQFKLNAVGAGPAVTSDMDFMWRADRNPLEAPVGVKIDCPFYWHVNGPTGLGTPHADGIFVTDRFPFDMNNVGAIDVTGWFVTAR